ncbi:unnamed protein product [Calicophoron daubneyi]|uniref:O-phosphoseryl-tRNA(Sec) selenium transferase n=1 Tax=Calicophoron daubneyi TaxID=300641 RepID=A0AAV2T0N7_CALDB
MNKEIIHLMEPYISKSYVSRSIERFAKFGKKFATVLSEGRLPVNGFAESEIEVLLLQLSSMDSNNWENSVGVGEREGRVLLDLVRRRHYRLTHGIGRSGDIAAIQPKASGSSLINRLTNRLLLDWLRRSGCPSTVDCFLVPMATGMSLTLCLLAMKKRRPSGARFVIWPRIDQKSCFKSMLAAGLIPVPINLREGTTDSKRCDACEDQLFCDIESIRQALIHPGVYLLEQWPEAAALQGITKSNAWQYGPESIVCVLSTTLCFSPRVPDRLYAITKECINYGVSHLVNNAYGVQSVRCMKMLEASGQLLLQYQQNEETSLSSNHEISAQSIVSNSNQLPESAPRKVDPKTCGTLPIDLIYVQSADKNLMVPVGGAIIAGFSVDLISAVAKTYPGRASATPSIDVFATLLYLGSKGWNELLEQRSACFERLRSGLERVAKQHQLRVLATPDNPISIALALNNLCVDADAAVGGVMPSPEALSRLTQLGAHLFTQGCSGVRVVLPATAVEPTQLGDYKFPGFGSHSSTSTVAYLNAAAAVGQSEREIDMFLARLDKALGDFRRSNKSHDNSAKLLKSEGD